MRIKRLTKHQRFMQEIFKVRSKYKGVKNLHCKEGLGKLFGVKLK